MNQAYLWDTNIAVYYLQQQFPPFAAKVLDDIVDNSQICFSVITEIELFSWKTAAPFDLDLVSLFVDIAFLFDLKKDIRQKAAELLRQHDLELPDAIVAATALIHDLTLITNNTSDFARIKNLHVLNPFDPQ